MRRHRQDRAGGDDAAAADAGEQPAPRRCGIGTDGLGSPAANSFSRACQCGSASGARGGPATVTKLGQKPLRQDRSTLQLVGLMRRLRPSAVSTGSIAMQLDCAEQSPQFSQTCLVDHHAAASAVPSCRACGGGASRWRRPGRRSGRRRRRSRAARAAPRRVPRGCGASRRGQRGRRWQPLRLVGHDGDALDAFRGDLCGDLRTVEPPSAGWPPVIATASLNSSL